MVYESKIFELYCTKIHLLQFCAVPRKLHDAMNVIRQLPEIVEFARFFVFKCSRNARGMHTESACEKLFGRTRQQFGLARAILFCESMIAGRKEVFRSVRRTSAQSR